MKINYYLITLMLFFINISCQTMKLPHSSLYSETVTLKLVDSTRYKFIYYNLMDKNFTLTYNTGKYTRDSKNYYLFPDSINNEVFKIHYSQKKIESIGLKLKMTVKTNIDNDYLNINKIIIFNNIDSMIVKNNLDTVFEHFKFSKFKIKIFLSAKYSHRIPLPSFTSITTEQIFLDTNSNSIDIVIPAEWFTFYYDYTAPFKLIDSDKFWIYNNKNILKDNTLIK